MHKRRAMSEALVLIRRFSPPPVLRWREASYFRRHGEFELRLVRPLCEPDRDAIDVGANLGAYVHFLRPASRLVHAFEPVPSLAAQLARKFTSGLTVHNVALSNENGTAILRVPIADGQPDYGLSSLGQAPDAVEHVEIEVATRRLDDAYEGDPGFMKIDVEGHELAVIEGAATTIDRSRPNLLVEIEERFAAGAVQRSRRFLERLGYEGYFVGGGVLQGIGNFDPKSMQRPEDIAGFGAGLDRTRFASYVNNFIFIHRSAERRILPQIRALTQDECLTRAG